MSSIAWTIACVEECSAGVGNMNHMLVIPDMVQRHLTSSSRSLTAVLALMLAGSAKAFIPLTPARCSSRHGAFAGANVVGLSLSRITLEAS